MKVIIIAIWSVQIKLFLVRKDYSVPLLHPGHMISSKMEPCSLAYIIKGWFFLIFKLFRCFALSITRLTVAKLASTPQLYLILAEDRAVFVAVLMIILLSAAVVAYWNPPFLFLPYPDSIRIKLLTTFWLRPIFFAIWHWLSRSYSKLLFGLDQSLSMTFRVPYLLKIIEKIAK